MVNLFVALCRFHAEQQSTMSRVKEVEKPFHSPDFLSLLEIDLMDFRNCPCKCIEQHTWAINIIDHHTKYVYISPLINNTADEVLRVLLQEHGFPRTPTTQGLVKFQTGLGKRT